MFEHLVKVLQNGTGKSPYLVIKSTLPDRVLQRLVDYFQCRMTYEEVIYNKRTTYYSFRVTPMKSDEFYTGEKILAKLRSMAESTNEASVELVILKAITNRFEIDKFFSICTEPWQPSCMLTGDGFKVGMHLRPSKYTSRDLIRMLTDAIVEMDESPTAWIDVYKTNTTIEEISTALDYFKQDWIPNYHTHYAKYYRLSLEVKVHNIDDIHRMIEERKRGNDGFIIIDLNGITPEVTIQGALLRYSSEYSCQIKNQGKTIEVTLQPKYKKPYHVKSVVARLKKIQEAQVLELIRQFEHRIDLQTCFDPGVIFRVDTQVINEVKTEVLRNFTSLGWDGKYTSEYISIWFPEGTC